MKFIKSFLVVIISITLTSSALSQEKQDSVKNISVKVKGINCAMDVKTIATNIEHLKGVTSCTASKPGTTTRYNIKYNPAQTSEKDIHAAIENTGGCENPDEKPYKIIK